MKQVLFILFLITFLLGGCDIRKREQILTQRENELNKKEQQLLLKERELQLKEEDLMQRSQSLDSINNKNLIRDSVFFNPEFVGTWSVQMNCIETSCPGSALGDVKSELWDISYKNNKTIATVIDKAKVVRVYSGTSTSNTIEMNFLQNNTGTGQSTNMIVRLEQTEKNRLEGRREITRLPGNCKIVYAVEMVKQ